MCGGGSIASIQPQVKAEGIRPGKKRGLSRETPRLPSRQEDGTRSLSKRYVRNNREKARPLPVSTAASSAHQPFLGEKCNYLLA